MSAMATGHKAGAVASHLDFLASPDALTLKAVQTLTGRSAATVWRWILRGVKGQRLATVKVVGRVYVSRAELDRFLAAVEAADVPSPPVNAPSPKDVDRELAKRKLK